jgi:hypothetical protein
MSLADRWHRIALAAVFGIGVMLLSPPTRAGDGSAEPKPTPASDGSCEAGQAREGRDCMHQIAPPGACAIADGGDCGDRTIGAASERFSPTDVAAGGSDAFNPPAPGPGPLPQPQPCDIGCGGPAGPPPAPPAPPITLRESPARPDTLPGLP